MKRRDFVKSASLSAAAVASVASGLHILPSPALAQGTRANFQCQGALVRAGGTDVVLISGSGSFNSTQVEGEGSFTHFQPGGAAPFPVLGSGTWKAGKVVSWSPIGVYGAHAAGILEMEATFVPTGVAPIAGSLKVVCNIPPGNLSTGLPEGSTLTLPVGTFGPAGVTLFSTGVEQRRG